jgi:CspA family cold shock protein
MVRATVREWHDDLGWGVLDSAETPGGCWAHFSAIETPTLSSEGGVTVSVYKTVSAGDWVDLAWEAPGQDGFAFRAIAIRTGP